MSSADFLRPVTNGRRRALARAFASYSDTYAPPASRLGVALFWLAVACLLVARVALFDASAPRAVGSFPDLIAPSAAAR